MKGDSRRIVHHACELGWKASFPRRRTRPIVRAAARAGASRNASAPKISPSSLSSRSSAPGRGALPLSISVADRATGWSMPAKCRAAIAFPSRARCVKPSTLTSRSGRRYDAGQEAEGHMGAAGHRRRGRLFQPQPIKAWCAKPPSRDCATTSYGLDAGRCGWCPPRRVADVVPKEKHPAAPAGRSGAHRGAAQCLLGESRQARPCPFGKPAAEARASCRAIRFSITRGRCRRFPICASAHGRQARRRQRGCGSGSMISPASMAWSRWVPLNCIPGTP